MLETFKGSITTIQKDLMIDTAALFVQYWGRGHGLKPEGKPHFEEFLRKVKAGERSDPASNIQIFNGFTFSTEGAELLKNQKRILLLSNHSVEGPLRGYGNTLVIDSVVEQAAGERIRWAQGHGSSIVDKIHDALGQTMNTITVADGNGISGVKEIIRAWERGESVGLYPEGVQKKALQKGDPRAGKVMLLAARKDISIFTAVSYFENDHFSVAIDKLDNQLLAETVSNPFGNTPSQHAVDLAMNTMAPHLPPHKRGRYKLVPSELPREKI
ncbi:MAG: hypothetical protein WD967_00650 [Candidatus Levyibacteriota bacterium]